MPTSPIFDEGALSTEARIRREATVRGAFHDPRARLPLADGRILGPADGPEVWLEALFAARPTDWLRRIDGRETFAWPAAPLARSPENRPPESAATGLVIKRYRGDEARDRWYERLRGRESRSPGRREGENLAALASLALPVPRVLAWFEDARAERSAVVMERLPGSRHLRAALRSAASTRGGDRTQRRLWARELVQLTARLHGAGWYHRDLYLVHFLLAPGLHLLDVGRARREPRPRRRWFVKDLAALLVSAPPEVSAPARLRFLRDYLRLRGLDGRGALRAWARAVEAKAFSLAAHAPRHVDPRDGTRRY